MRHQETEADLRYVEVGVGRVEVVFRLVDAVDAQVEVIVASIEEYFACIDIVVACIDNHLANRAYLIDQTEDLIASIEVAPPTKRGVLPLGRG